MKPKDLETLKEAVFSQVIEGELSRDDICNLISELISFAVFISENTDFMAEFSPVLDKQIAESDNVISIEKFKHNKMINESYED